jgi:hypothetical protein
MGSVIACPKVILLSGGLFSNQIYFVRVKQQTDGIAKIDGK